jgi:hypothetical protein
MAIGAGLGGQIGIAKETTVNTPVAVSTFNPVLSSTMAARIQAVDDAGIQGTIDKLAARRVITGIDAGGDVTMNVASKGFGKWLQMGLGSSATATQLATTGAYQQLHNLGSADGAAFTIQQGVPEISGTVDPGTYGGCKTTAWEFACAPNGLATWKATIDAMSFAPAGAGALALQAASYTADQNFGFNNIVVNTFAAMTVVSGLWTPTTPTSAGIVRNISLKGGQPKKTDRWQAGSQTKAEALGNNFTMATGQIDIDYASVSSAMGQANYLSGATVGLQILATGSIVGTSGTNVATVGFVMPAIKLEQGSMADLSGVDVVTVSYPFTIYNDGTNGSMQGQIISTDATV